MKFLEARREVNYDMYINLLGEIAPWMFYFNHYHMLKESSQNTHAEFQKGHVLAHDIRYMNN